MNNHKVVSSTTGSVDTGIGDCKQVNHLGIANTKVNSAFHPSVVDKSSTSLIGSG